MKNTLTLDKEGFLDVLLGLSNDTWIASVENRCLHLRRIGSSIIYSPLTAVYWHLTREELHRGSFWHPEITERFRLPWCDILDITYAEICCSCNGKHYSSKLRVEMLEAVAPLVRFEAFLNYLTNLMRERQNSEWKEG